MKQVLHCLAVAGIALLLSCAAANADLNAPAPTLAETGSLEVGGRQRTYQWHAPNLTGKLPLLIALHGGNGSGQGMRSLTGLDALADRYGFVVAYPDGLYKNWADGRGTTDAERAGVNDVQFISSLIAQFVGTGRVQASRVYVAGISNGGMMTARLACEVPGIAAVAMVAATMPEALSTTCNPARAVPLMLVHGTEDRLVPAAGGNLPVGDGGRVLSVQATIAHWRSLNGCTQAPTSSVLDAANDGTRTTLERYQGCRDQTEVVLYRVEGGGHTWPGGLQYLPERLIGKTSRDFDAGETAWAFFKRFARAN